MLRTMAHVAPNNISQSKAGIQALSWYYSEESLKNCKKWLRFTTNYRGDMAPSLWIRSRIMLFEKEEEERAWRERRKRQARATSLKVMFEKQRQLAWLEIGENRIYSLEDVGTYTTARINLLVLQVKY